MDFLIILVCAYLMGSLPFAVIVSRCLGLSDPRQYGSGNPGATNVLRSGNKKAAALTLLGDAAKGWLVVALAQHFSATLDLHASQIAMLGLAAFLGHVYSIFLKFKGGKGVATALGVLLGLHWGLALSALAVWLAVALATRFSSLAAICAALSAPIAGWLILSDQSAQIALVPMCAVLLWRHRANIVRLLSGTESRIGARS